MEKLLRSWLDALIELQITDMKRSELHGGILCPACASIHGRCADAFQPMMYMHKRTGERKYLESALMLYDWTESNMSQPDGSYRNDANAAWNGITVFYAVALGEALHHYGGLLPEGRRPAITARLKRAFDFLHDNIMKLDSVINYPITCSAAMAVAHRQFGDERYAVKARELAAFALEHIGVDGLIFGEGSPHEGVTDCGCRPVDLGYNVEESLPSLILYAQIMNDQAVLDAARASMAAHLEFMLPDGAWDNSWGVRVYKWTTWGSRTSDGCAYGYGSQTDIPAFAEAALRNVELLRSHTHGGLLYGGPMYVSAKQPPCVHHTFCHAKPLAALLELGAPAAPSVPLPREAADGAKYFPTPRVTLLAKGPWRATVSQNHWPQRHENQPSGGALTLLWHDAAGVVLAGSMTRYQMIEPNNMQLPPGDANGFCFTPRVETVSGGVAYRSVNDHGSALRHAYSGDALILTAEGVLRDGAQNTFGSRYALTYTLTAQEFAIEAYADTDATLYLPVIAASSEEASLTANTLKVARKAPVTVTCTAPFLPLDARARVFNHVGGTEALPLALALPAGKRMRVAVRVG